MFIFAYFLEGVAVVLDTLLRIYFVIIIIRAVLSWVSPDPYNPIVRFLHAVTDPLLYQVRRLLPFPSYYSGIDFSPIFVLLAIYFLQTFLVQTLLHLSRTLL